MHLTRNCLLITLLVGLLALLTGCANQSNGMNVSNAWLATLRKDVHPGMTQKQVMHIVGSPVSQVKSDDGQIETWVYLRPLMGTVRLVFNDKKEFLTWYTWFDDFERPLPRGPNPYDDVSDQLRGLRMDNAVYRSQLPW